MSGRVSNRNAGSYSDDEDDDDSFVSALSHEGAAASRASGSAAPVASAHGHVQTLTQASVRAHEYTQSGESAPTHRRTGTRSDDDDWGVAADELWDEDPVSPGQFIRRDSRRNSLRPGSGFYRNTMTSITTDSLRLRAFDEPRTLGGVATDNTYVPNLIGRYADPSEKDDWGNDFEFDQLDEFPLPLLHSGDDSEPPPPTALSWGDVQHRDSSRHHQTGQPHAPGALRLDSEHSLSSSFVTGIARSQSYAASNNEILPPLQQQQQHHRRSVRFSPSTNLGDEEEHASSATAASTQPILGYNATEVHQSCAHLKELFSRHSRAIQQHVDGIISELGKVSALDQQSLAAYLLSVDADVSMLSDSYKEAAPDFLQWKLELAMLMNDQFATAQSMLGLARHASAEGDFDSSEARLAEVLEILHSIEESNAILSLIIEAYYEAALTQRRLGRLERAMEILEEAILKCKALVQRPENDNDLLAPEQRGVWWSLRNKYLLAEITADQGNLPEAIQLYAEYAVESVARMIGLIAPEYPGNSVLGNALMQYCLFSPRSLVFSIYSTALCLNEIRAFHPATDMASVAMDAATLFGHKDIYDAAQMLRSRAKASIRDFRKQLGSNVNSSADSREPASVNGQTRNPSLDSGNVALSTAQSVEVDDYDGSVESEEDWDKELEQELNIHIERCSNVAAFPDVTPLSGSLSVTTATGLPRIPSNIENEGRRPIGSGTMQDSPAPSRVAGGHFFHGKRSTSTDLIEAELRLYLNRMHGASASLSALQMYPKPTPPVEGPILGVKEHEAFLRNFVRGKDPRFSKSLAKGTTAEVWDPRKLDETRKENPMKFFRSKAQYIDRLSSRWAILVLQTVWDVLRGDGHFEEKSASVRTLLQATIHEAAEVTARVPVRDTKDRQERLDIVAGLLEALRLAREILTPNGSESIWFSRSCSLLNAMAKTVAPAAKAAVELFQAESRAHCGVVAVTAPAQLRQVAKKNPASELDGSSGNQGLDVPDVHSSLRQSVVDVLHALFWRTKSGFDENSDKECFERLVHADVASTLFLTGSGMSPVDGSGIDLAKDEAILNLRRKGGRQKESRTVDETRRVSGPELVKELQTLWASLPSSAGAVRAKVSFALACHSSSEPHEYGHTERFLFDGLLSLHSVSPSFLRPISFYSCLAHVSPIGIVSSPLSQAMLSSYGNLTLRHGKYRYGIAALEAASDCQRVRDLSNNSASAKVTKIATTALSKGDWRRAVVLLYDLRHLIHPKDGKRNEFVHLCVLLHQICIDVGCFAASIVPLRAYSALIYEERLRILLRRYRRRLARKTRARNRMQFAASPLPTMLSKTPLLKTQSTSLAVLFDSPIRSGGNAFDGTFLRPPTLSPTLSNISNLSTPIAPNTVPKSKPSRLRKFSSWFSDGQKGNAKALTVTQMSEAPTQSSSSPKRDPKFPARNPYVVRKLVERPEKRESSLAATVKPATPTKYQFEEEQKELFRIEAEQELVADADRFEVEFLFVKASFSSGDLVDAESRCKGLLGMKMSHSCRYRVFEVLARILLKRREISRCLEMIERLEEEYRRGLVERSVAPTGEVYEDYRESSDASRASSRGKLFELNSNGGSAGSTSKPFIPAATFLKLSALLHGCRLDEALSLADDSLALCPDTELWNRAKLHYLRGKTLYAISSFSTAPFDRGEVLLKGSKQNSAFDLRNVDLTLSAFETASRYFDAAGDEVGMMKSDLLWSRTCIDTLFRRVVLPQSSGGGMKLSDACILTERTISTVEVEDAVHNVLYMASTANLPLLLIDALAALAEIKCIRGEPASKWNIWTNESWKLFSRLLTDSEDFTVVLSPIAPVSKLMRLRNLCGRLVRLVLCDQKAENVSTVNRHLRLFETYVTLQVDIERRMNLASKTHRKSEELDSENQEIDAEQSPVVPNTERHTHATKLESRNAEKTRDLKGEAVEKHHDLFAAVRRQYGHEKRGKAAQTDDVSDTQSGSSHEAWTSNRPAGAFLHAGGLALGKLGLSFINKPRKHVISAVRETGAVLIPSNFFANSRVNETSQTHILGKDAEMIFPFKDKLGLGAMQILDGPCKNMGERPSSLKAEERQPETSQFEKLRTTKNTNVDSDRTPDRPRTLDCEPPSSLAKTQRAYRDINLDAIRPRQLSFLDPDGTHWVPAYERGKRSISDTGSDSDSNARGDVQDEVEPVHSVAGESLAFKRSGQSTKTHGQSNDESKESNGETLGSNDCDKQTESEIKADATIVVTDDAQSELIRLIESVRNPDDIGSGTSGIFGRSRAARVWAHLHRIKTETRRYVHGGITLEELGNRNGEALRSWLLCLPPSDREWTVPESIGKRLVYVLYAHGIVGYYVVDRGGCIAGVGFGGKQLHPTLVDPAKSHGLQANGPRSLTDAERSYLYQIVKDWKRGSGAWYKDRDSEIIQGLAESVLRAPRQLLGSSGPSHKSKSRPIILVSDLSLQVVPWELFFDHVVIRSLCLLDIIRGLQEDTPQPGLAIQDTALLSPGRDPTRPITRFVTFSSSRREGAELERTEETRRQQLAFQAVLRLNHLSAPALISKLSLGGFSDPTALNATTRPTGPLSTPLSQSRKTVKLFGMRLGANIGQRNYPHVDFLRVPGLGSASTADLKESAMAFMLRNNNDPESDQGGGVSSYPRIHVFLFSYADLVDTSESVFGLIRAVPRGMLMFTPAVNMKVLVRHLEDDELTKALDRVYSRDYRRVKTDIYASARILVEYVSRFSREKRIPIVVFLGDGLVDVFPRKKVEFLNNNTPRTRLQPPAAEALFNQRPTTSPFRVL